MCTFKITAYVVLMFIASASTAVSDVKNDNSLSVIQLNWDAIFQRTSLLYGLSAVSTERLVEKSCHTDLQKFQKGVIHREPWALKMFDASSSLESGFTFGHNFWLGNRDVCNAVGQPVNLHISTHIPHHMNPQLLTSVAPFPTDFRVIYLRHNSSWQIDPHIAAFETRLHMGLCVPRACAEHDIQHLINTYFTGKLFAANEFYEMHLEYDYAKDFSLKAGTFNRKSFYLYCAIIVITIALTLAAALMRNSDEPKQNPVDVQHKTFSSSTENLAVRSDAATELVAASNLCCSNVIACFDVKKNFENLFTPDKVQRTFAALDGLRFGSALAVTLYHYLIFLFHAIRNKATLLNILVIGNLNLFVDIFFTISGFLQSYNHFRNKQMLAQIRQNNFIQNLKLIGVLIIHRLLRLAPLYYLVIALSDFGVKFMNDTTVFHIEHNVHVNCERYWWRNVLFIQNLFDHNDMCSLWTWSMACDMQFAILGTVLLFTFIKHPRLAISCLISLVFANILYTCAVGIRLNFDLTLESTCALLTEIYIHPLSRILPYIIGGTAGWFFVEYKAPPFTLNKNFQHLFEAVLTLIFFACILNPIFENFSTLTSTMILLLERFVFALASSVLFVLNGRGKMRWFFGIFESFIFQKFQKVSYAMYLLNPIVTFAVPGYSQSSLYVNPFIMVIEYIGIVVVLVPVCIIFTLLFVTPFQNLSRLLLSDKQNKNKRF